MSLNQLLLGTMSGAMIVMVGGLYALFYALGCLQSNRRFIVAAYVCFAILVISAVLLVDALNLSGLWSIVIATMLIGYFLAPRAIWHLCVGTHMGEPSLQTSNTSTEGGQHND